MLELQKVIQSVHRNASLTVNAKYLEQIRNVSLQARIMGYANQDATQNTNVLLINNVFLRSMDMEVVKPDAS